MKISSYTEFSPGLIVQNYSIIDTHIIFNIKIHVFNIQVLHFLFHFFLTENKYIKDKERDQL